MAPSCKLELARFSALLRIQDGSECGTPSSACFLNPSLNHIRYQFGLKCFSVIINFGSKNSGSLKKLWVRKSFGSKIFFGLKNLGTKHLLAKIEFRKNFGSGKRTYPDLTRPDLAWPNLTFPYLTSPDLMCPELTCPDFI